MLLDCLTRGLALVILLTALPLSAAALAGFLTAVVQTATQIQEQSLSFLIKLGSVTAVLALLSRWLGGEVLAFSQEMIETVAYLGRL